jgi:hypothetical protein
MRGMWAVVVALLVSFGRSSPATHGDADLKDTNLGDMLWRIAAATHTRAGFQSIGRAPWFPRLKERIDPQPLDESRAVDAAVAADSRYEWHMVGGTAVIRPREAWTDPGDGSRRWRVRGLCPHCRLPMACSFAIDVRPL